MHVRHFSVRSHLFTRKGLTMGGTPNGLKQFLLQGRTTIKENVFQNCLRSYPLWEGMMDFHAWVGSKITHGCFYFLSCKWINKSFHLIWSVNISSWIWFRMYSSITFLYLPTVST